VLSVVEMMNVCGVCKVLEIIVELVLFVIVYALPKCPAESVTVVRVVSPTCTAINSRWYRDSYEMARLHIYY
jgi:hypothetical protein